MKDKIISLTVVLGATMLPLLLVCASGAGALQVEKHRKAIVDARSFEDVKPAYKALFKDSQLLNDLKCDLNASIALQAAWEACRRTDGSRDAIHRFLGFVEGKTSLTVPLRWEVSLLRNALRNEPEILDDVLRRRLQSCAFLRMDNMTGKVAYEGARYRESVLGLWVPEDTRATQTEGSLEFATPAGRVRFLDKLLTDLKRGRYGRLENCVVSIGDRHTYVALFSAMPGQYPVICIDSRNGRLVWQSDVWVPRSEFLTGPGLHDVSIVVRNNVVACFGQGVDCYLEAFEIETGKSVFRFSTYYASSRGR